MKNSVRDLKSKDKAEGWEVQICKHFHWLCSGLNYPRACAASHKHPQTQVSVAPVPTHVPGSLSPCFCRHLPGPVPHSPHSPGDAKGPHRKGHHRTTVIKRTCRYRWSACSGSWGPTARQLWSLRGGVDKNMWHYGLKLSLTEGSFNLKMPGTEDTNHFRVLQGFSCKVQ